MLTAILPRRAISQTSLSEHNNVSYETLTLVVATKPHPKTQTPRRAKLFCICGFESSFSYGFTRVSRGTYTISVLPTFHVKPIRFGCYSQATGLYSAAVAYVIRIKYTKVCAYQNLLGCKTYIGGCLWTQNTTRLLWHSNN